MESALLTMCCKLATNDTRHYPDTNAHIWIVNAPYLFHGLSKLIRPFLNEDTLAKLHISSHVPPALADSVGKECLPIELGGSRTNIFPYNELAPVSEYPHKKT